MSRVIQLMTLGEGRSLTRKIDGTENCEKRCHHETTGNSQERQTRRHKFEVLGGVNPPYASGEVAKEKQGI
jgi:hypothetical protein